MPFAVKSLLPYPAVLPAEPVPDGANMSDVFRQVKDELLAVCPEPVERRDQIMYVGEKISVL